jgi:hypothetical protein
VGSGGLRGQSRTVAEEIESLGQSGQLQLSNRLTILLGHMLKWEFQPAQPKGGWEATIKEQRYRVDRLIEKNPSLALVEETYRRGVSAGCSARGF